MPRENGRVKVIVATGVSPADAIAASLDSSFSDFAKRHGFTKSAVSMCIHGKQRHDRVRAALAEALGVEREWLDEQLDRVAAAGQAA